MESTNLQYAFAKYLPDPLSVNSADLVSAAFFQLIDIKDAVFDGLSAAGLATF